MIPRAIFRLDLDPAARLLLALLWTYARHDERAPFVWPSPALLAGHLRCTTRSVRRSLQALREAGYVAAARRTVTWRGGSHTVAGWMLVLERSAATLDDLPPPELHEGEHPEIDADADDLVRDRDVDGGDVDDLVRPADIDADDLVHLKRTISSAHPLDGSVNHQSSNSAAGRGLFGPGSLNSLAPARKHAALVDGVLEAMRVACTELRGRGGAGPDDCEANRKLIERCAKLVRRAGQSDEQLLEDFRMVVSRQLASVRADPSAWKYLSLSTLCRPANFLRLRDAVDGGGRGPRRAWSSEQEGEEE